MAEVAGAGLIVGIIVIAYFIALFVCLAVACGHLSKINWNLQRILAAIENPEQQDRSRPYSR